MILLLVVFWFGLYELDFDNVEDLRISPIFITPLLFRNLSGRSCADGPDPLTKVATDNFSSSDTSTGRWLT
jgi:hypothetical protein